MNWDAIGAIGEIVGALAVVFSLVYLAAQIRQSNTLGKSQTRREIVRADQQLLNIIVEYPEIYDAVSKDEISRAEKIRLQEWLFILMRNREFDWLQWQDGLIDDDTFDTYKAVIPMVLGMPRGRRWWEVYRDAYSPKFATFVDELLQSSGPVDLIDAFDRW